MSKSIFILIILFSFLNGCNDSIKPHTDDIINYSGVVKDNSDGLYLIISDISYHDYNTLYPTNLGNEFRKDSLKIRFSGNIESDPPSPVPYPPLHISKIEILN